MDIPYAFIPTFIYDGKILVVSAREVVIVIVVAVSTASVHISVVYHGQGAVSVWQT
jgi:hypothetical protein